MEPKIKVGIPVIGSREWMGGVAYTELLVKAVSTSSSDQRPLLFLMVNEGEQSQFELYRSFLHCFDGVIHCGDLETNDLPLPHYRVCDSRDGLQMVDILFPINFSVRRDFPSISWIPDFQHKYLPHLFTPEDFQDREQRLLAIAGHAKMVVFSSEDARRDFEYFYPDSNARTRVLHFYSLPQPAWYATNAWEIARKYGINGPYAICCNQLWKHKNHMLLFEAVKQLRDAGIRLDLICTGSVTDYRNPDYHREILQYLHDHHLTEQIRLLGFIPRADQIQLIRASSFLIQPSLFEGWSTVVEDGRVLGKRMILSDLNVHIEQNPKHALYFERSNCLSLKSKILEMIETPEPIAATDRETACKEDALVYVKQYCQTFCEIVQQGTELHQVRGSVLVVCIPAGDWDTSIDPKTLRCIEQQTLNSISGIVFGEPENIDFNRYNAEFIFLIQNKDECDPLLMESLLRLIENEADVVLCGLAITKLNGGFMSAPVYPDEQTADIDSIKAMSGVMAGRSLLSGMRGGGNNRFFKPQTVSNLYTTRSLFDQLTPRLNGKRRLLIYGAGKHTRDLLQQFDFSMYSIVGLLDKNHSIFKATFGDIPVVSPTQLHEFEFDAIVISSYAFEKEIYEELSIVVNPDKIVRIYRS